VNSEHEVLGERETRRRRKKPAETSRPTEPRDE